MAGAPFDRPSLQIRGVRTDPYQDRRQQADHACIAGEDRCVAGHSQALNSRTAFYYGYTLDSPGMIMRLPNVGSQYLMGFMDADKNLYDGRQRPTG
jgi:hypothetical protein